MKRSDIFKELNKSPVPFKLVFTGINIMGNLLLYSFMGDEFPHILIISNFITAFGKGKENLCTKNRFRKSLSKKKKDYKYF